MKKSIKILANELCRPCRKGDPILDAKTVRENLKSLTAWQLNSGETDISRRFSFKNFDETMYFINQLAKISTINDHHPDICFGYNYCQVSYSTHAIQGLSENDFICSAKVDVLFSER